MASSSEVSDASTSHAPLPAAPPGPFSCRTERLLHLHYQHTVNHDPCRWPQGAHRRRCSVRVRRPYFLPAWGAQNHSRTRITKDEPRRCQRSSAYRTCNCAETRQCDGKVGLSKSTRGLRVRTWRQYRTSKLADSSTSSRAELGRAAWKVLHTTFARFPEKPTEEEKEALRSYVHLFQRLYPWYVSLL